MLRISERRIIIIAEEAARSSLSPYRGALGTPRSSSWLNQNSQDVTKTVALNGNSRGIVKR